jgi:hypothetical protein
MKNPIRRAAAERDQTYPAVCPGEQRELFLTVYGGGLSCGKGQTEFPRGKTEIALQRSENAPAAAARGILQHTGMQGEHTSLRNSQKPREKISRSFQWKGLNVVVIKYLHQWQIASSVSLSKK